MSRLRALFARHDGHHVHAPIFAGWGGMATAWAAYRDHPVLRSVTPPALIPLISIDDIHRRHRLDHR
ncbi:MAG TPA: hypothetical protein VIR33_19010 [Thermopolyspora sp.]